MSISSEITRISSAKAAIKGEIEKLGVEVPDNARIDEYADFISQGLNLLDKVLLYQRTSLTNTQTITANLNDNISNYDYLMFVFRETYNSGSLFYATYDTKYFSLSQIKPSAGYIGTNPLSITKKSDTQISISATPTGGTWAGQISEIYGLKGQLSFASTKKNYLFHNGAFVQQPSSNSFKISGENLTNGDNTTSCKWTDLNDKIKIFILIGKYRDIDGNIQVASSGFTPTFKTINIQTSWNSGAGKYHDVTFVAIGKDLSLQTIAYGTGSYQMQYSEIYYYEL